MYRVLHDMLFIAPDGKGTEVLPAGTEIEEVLVAAMSTEEVALFRSAAKRESDPAARMIAFRWRDRFRFAVIGSDVTTTTKRKRSLAGNLVGGNQ